MQRLTRADVPLDTVALAQGLIGIRVVRVQDDGTLVSGRIVETEAYTPGDPASHAFRGMTPRNRVMFGAHLHAYVYFIYGTAYCLNVSSESEGVGAAVLIRALEPLDGIESARSLRGAHVSNRDLMRGPGRLCAALGIDRRFDGADLETDARLWLADDGTRRPVVGASPRIGLTRGVDAHRRYFARGSRYLSGRRSLSPDI